MSTNPTGLRETAIAPEVHAAAITAAKDYLMARPELAGLTSDMAAVTIAMHAAMILRGYLDFLESPDLLPTHQEPPPPPEAE